MMVYDFVSRFINKLKLLGSRTLNVSIGDLLLSGVQPSGLQFLVASRIIDINRYLEGEEHFHYQTSFSTADTPSYNSVNGDKIFKNIVLSFLENGYKHISPFPIVDRQCCLVDGTHRLAMCYCIKNYEIQVQMVRTKAGVLFPDHFYRSGIASDDLNAVNLFVPTMHRSLINDGCGFAASVHADCGLFDRFTSDLSAFVNDMNIMHGEDGTHHLVLFRLANPCYRADKNRIVSKRIIQLREIFTDRYKNDSICIEFSDNCSDGKSMYDAYEMKAASVQKKLQDYGDVIIQ